MERGPWQDVSASTTHDEARSLVLTVGVLATIVALPALLAVAMALASG